jgi:hypothetical protein
MKDSAESVDRGAAVTGLLAVVAANVLYLAGLSRILDPMLAMEPFYIHMAAQPAPRILAENPAWGPLYALWLKPFRALLAEPLAVYTANVQALSLAVSVAIYLHLLLLTRRAAVAAGAALFFLVCDLNVPLPSKVNGFALLIVLAGTALSHLAPAGGRRAAVAAAAVLLASYARPELYPAGLCLCLAALWLARREGKESGSFRAAWWAALLLLAAALAAMWIGTPVFSPYHENDRLFSAFREHFAWNWGRWHGGRHFLAVWEQEFGDAATIAQALARNPAVFARHLGDNAIGTIRFMTASAFDHYPVLAAATWPTLVEAENLLAAAAALGSIAFVAARPALRRAIADRYGDTLFGYALIASFSLGSATLVYPRSHYLVIPAVLLLLAAALAASVILPAGPALSGKGRLLAAVVCLVAVPRPFVLPSSYAVAGSPFPARITVARPIADTIELIRSLRLPAPVHVLTLNDGIGEMLGDGFHEIKAWQRNGRPLAEYLREKHVDVIVTLEPGQESFVLDDPYWKVIQFRPEEAGFAPVPVPEHETVRVWVRSGLK